MVIKTNVTPEEKEIIQACADAEGKSMAAYLRSKALLWVEPTTAPALMQLIETQAPVLQRINEIATTVIQNKVIYEAEILELLDRISWIEDVTAAAVKEVTKHGNSE